MSMSMSTCNESDMIDTDTSSSNINITCMLTACSTGDLATIHALLQQDQLYACLQDDATGQSPLMVAAHSGYAPICRILLEHGAPWNALDRTGQCAGNFATDQQHWDIVNLLVDHATRAELILGSVARMSGTSSNSGSSGTNITNNYNYLSQQITYTQDGQSLLDADKDAVMMEWERPLMQAHAQLLLSQGRRTVMNVGFGMGIIDSYLQSHSPDLHIIIEAHPMVHDKMMQDKWNERTNVRIEFGTWQDILPKLVQEGIQVDAIFYDTFGEHYLDLEDFQQYIPKLLSKPNGMYSFFNGLAPDNLFFHGVACQCVKLQLGQLGLETEFIPCEIHVKDTVWEGIRRKYWHGRDAYYLPSCRWAANNTSMDQDEDEDYDEECCNAKKAKMEENEKREATNKRQRMQASGLDME